MNLERRDLLMMDLAKRLRQEGTCDRARVGAVFSREGRILSMGYNGAPKGHAHCDHTNSTDPCVVAAHAEENGVAWAARLGIPLLDSELHTSRVPCPICSRMIVNAGVRRVVWSEEHRINGVQLMRDSGLEVVRLV